MPSNTEAAKIAKAVMDATPTPVQLARELGEENFHGSEHGQFEVRAVDKHGAPDPKKAKLLREMFSDRTRLEKKLTALTPEPPRVEVEKPARGLSFGPPRGGWPVFGEDGRVIG